MAEKHLFTLDHPMAKIMTVFILPRGETPLEKVENYIPAGGGSPAHGVMKFGHDKKLHRRIAVSLDTFCVLGFSVNNIRKRPLAGEGERWQVLAWWDRNHPRNDGGLSLWGEPGAYLRGLLMRKWNVVNVFDNTPVGHPGHPGMWSFNFSQPMRDETEIDHLLGLEWSPRARELLSASSDEKTP